jgi:hypothetical protein
MNTLKNAREAIYNIKNAVLTNTPTIYNHRFLNKNTINDETVSIVMTSSNRSKQTYYTLDTIQRSAYKNVHVVIVDDSTVDPIDVSHLETYSFSIDFVEIIRSNKTWHNPCVNYNIGFKFVKGGMVIIQNAEVCHIGDVISYVVSNIRENTYFVFDVAASSSYTSNDIIYTLDSSKTDIYNNKLFDVWYQGQSNNRKYHFLTACNLNTFQKIGGFSYDYSMGSSYDDDDLVLRIIANSINIQPVHHTQINCGGIHLYHVRNDTPTSGGWDTGKESNEKLLNKKTAYFNKYKVYMEVSENDDTFIDNYNKLEAV